MKSHKIMIVLTILMGILTFSCKKEATSSGYFPENVGNKWVYSVIDSGNVKIDSFNITVEIVSEQDIDGKNFKTWRFTKNNVTLYSYFTIGFLDSVKFYEDINFSNIDWFLSFLLK